MIFMSKIRKFKKIQKAKSTEEKIKSLGDITTVMLEEITGFVEQINESNAKEILYNIAESCRQIINLIDEMRKYLNHYCEATTATNKTNDLKTNLLLEWLYIIYLELYSMFHFEQYKKIRKLIDISISNCDSMLDIIYAVSHFVGTIDSANNLKDLILSFNKKYLRKTYCCDSSSKFEKLEKQKEMIDYISDMQESLLKGFSLLVNDIENGDGSEK